MIGETVRPKATTGIVGGQGCISFHFSAWLLQGSAISIVNQPPSLPSPPCISFFDVDAYFLYYFDIVVILFIAGGLYSVALCKLSLLCRSRLFFDAALVSLKRHSGIVWGPGRFTNCSAVGV